MARPRRRHRGPGYRPAGSAGARRRRPGLRGARVPRDGPLGERGSGSRPCAVGCGSPHPRPPRCARSARVISRTRACRVVAVIDARASAGATSRASRPAAGEGAPSTASPGDDRPGALRVLPERRGVPRRDLPRCACAAAVRCARPATGASPRCPAPGRSRASPGCGTRGAACRGWRRRGVRVLRDRRERPLQADGVARQLHGGRVGEVLALAAHGRLDEQREERRHHSEDPGDDQQEGPDEEPRRERPERHPPVVVIECQTKAPCRQASTTSRRKPSVTSATRPTRIAT